MIRLDLSSNPEWWSDPIHGMRNWAILLDLIPKLPKLKHLYLTNNDLNASETLSVAQTLVSSQAGMTLTLLYLGGNAFDSLAAMALAVLV